MLPYTAILISCSISTLNAQVIHISSPLSWAEAELDCVSRGSHLLTAQGNTADINSCLSQSGNGGAWIGLNRINQADWDWVAADVTYVESEVNWANNAPSGNVDCAQINTQTGGQNGRITNRQISCADAKQYCCNPVITPAPTTPAPITPAPTAPTTPSPTTPAPTTPAPTAPTTPAPTTPSPTTPAPTTPAPTSPTTPAPTTPAPTTPAPTTPAPTTPAPTTPAPTTPAPTAPTTAAPTSGSCPRIRKEWNTISQSERDLYINGLLTLSAQGKLQKFTEQHGDLLAEDQAHGTSAFLTWHRLYLLELETQIRALGGQYECFGLPYWNWGKDVDDSNTIYSAYSVLNSGLGSSGDPSDNYCVTDGPFAKGSYTPYHCASPYTGNDGTCCLRRRTASDGSTQRLYTSVENRDVITTHDFYFRDDQPRRRRGIRTNIELGPHGNAHCQMGTCGTSGGHLGNGFYSPDDPIFYLLHGFVDYLWALWQDYHDYDLVDKNSLTNTHYDGRLSNSGIDTVLEFDILAAESWSTISGTETSRDMHSIEELGYKYDYGSFIDDVTFQTATLNANWFEDTDGRRRRTMQVNGDGTVLPSFDDVVYQQLALKFNVDTYNGQRQLSRTWAKMSCQYVNAGDAECERPAYYDNCEGMPLGLGQGLSNKPDINVTLDDLIEKVADYPCMIETRQVMYPWVAQMGGLARLCRGDFDTFCDREFLRE